MDRLGKYLLAKDANAIIVALVCALLPLFYIPTGFLAAIIIGLVTLQKGAKSGFWVVAWVALPAIATLVLRHVGPFDVLLARCLIIWGLAALLRSQRSLGLVLEVLALAGVLIIIALHFAVPNLQHWWVEQLTGYVNEVAKASEWKFSLTPAELVQRISPVATGVVAFFFCGGVVFELLLARFWQSIIAGLGSFGKEFVQIRIGRFAAGICAVLFILAMLKQPVFIDALPLAMLPFFVAGLSIMHLFARTKRPMLGVLIAVYVALIFVPIFVVSTLAAIGFMDSWTDFRKKVRTS